VPAIGQLGLQAQLGDVKPAFPQPVRVLAYGGHLDAVERLVPPQLQRGPESRHRVSQPPGLHRLPALSGGLLEPIQVQDAGRDLQHVAVGPREQLNRDTEVGERPPQPVHARLQRRLRRRRGSTVPQLVDQPLTARRPPTFQHQQSEQASLPGGRDGHRPAFEDSSIRPRTRSSTTEL
jgi:hypothetical protein